MTATLLVNTLGPGLLIQILKDTELDRVDFWLINP